MSGEEKKDTRQRIQDVALSMFAAKGYEAVSIRDIGKIVNIKESSIYYHFENKRAILDSIIDVFDSKSNEIMTPLVFLMSKHDSMKQTAYEWICQHYCDEFLFDGFCNNVMRLMVIEQFHDIKITAKYEECMFERPEQIMIRVLNILYGNRIEREKLDRLGTELFAFVTMLTYKLLLAGPLTEMKKEEFLIELKLFLEKKIREL